MTISHLILLGGLIFLVALVLYVGRIYLMWYQTRGPFSLVVHDNRRYLRHYLVAAIAATLTNVILTLLTD